MDRNPFWDQITAMIADQRVILDGNVLTLRMERYQWNIFASEYSRAISSPDLVAWLQATIGGNDVIDVHADRGYYSYLLAQRLPKRIVEAVDLSPWHSETHHPVHRMDPKRRYLVGPAMATRTMLMVAPKQLQQLYLALRAWGGYHLVVIASPAPWEDPNVRRLLDGEGWELRSRFAGVFLRDDPLTGYEFRRPSPAREVPEWNQETQPMSHYLRSSVSR